MLIMQRGLRAVAWFFVVSAIFVTKHKTSHAENREKPPRSLSSIDELLSSGPHFGTSRVLPGVPVLFFVMET